jgi:hypothetical protein
VITHSSTPTHRSGDVKIHEQNRPLAPTVNSAFANNCRRE